MKRLILAALAAATIGLTPKAWATDAATITTAPTPVAGLKYTGEAQTLVNAGTASGGTMEYSLDDNSWSTALPTGTDWGTYTVYYKAVGDANHTDSESGRVTAIIGKAPSYGLTVGPWTFDDVRTGWTGYEGAGTSISFDGLNDSRWFGDTYRYNDTDGCGYAYLGTNTYNSKYAVYSTYKHTETVPAYTRKVLTWNYRLTSWSSWFAQTTALYAADNLDYLKTLPVDFTEDYSDATHGSGNFYHLAHLIQQSQWGASTTDHTGWFGFDNRSGSTSADKTSALLLTQVIGDTTGVNYYVHNWGGFKDVSSSWTTYYYKHITFNANGGEGTMAVQEIENSGTLTANAFTRAGYVFTGWKDADGNFYLDKASVSATESDKGTVTLYAQWTARTYTVRFDANGGAGEMPDQIFTYNDYDYDAPLALTANAFTRTGYTFAGWRGADGSIYPDGAPVNDIIVHYIVRYASPREDTWKLFDRMPYPGNTNDDYRPGDGALQDTDGNGRNLYTGFENSAWNPENPETAALVSANAAWFDEHDARNGVSMKLIEDFPNFYKEPVDVAQNGVVTLTAIWRPPVPYIDADGNEQMCTIYTVLADAAGYITYGEVGAENWYVVTNDVTIGGWLDFADYNVHLILCDGATLTVTNAIGVAIVTSDNLAIYGQANGSGTLAVTSNGNNGIQASGGVTINGGSVIATGGEYGYGIQANGTITLGWTAPTDSIYASSYNGKVSVKDGKLLTDGYGGIYESTIQDPYAIAGKTLRPGFKDPEGAAINDYAIIEWLANNGFTQADINALGHDADATDRLYECWLLNLNFKVQDAGATLSFTDITVSNRVSMTVQFVRKAPLAGRINGYLYLYGANDLAAGFDRSPIPDESVEYFTGDPTFNLVTASNDTVTQTAVATLNSSVTAKFFKAEIGVFIPYEPEEPWEPEPEPEPEPEE